MELSFAQKQVIQTKNKSLLVSASAGSGKTFVVIERIVQSIKEGADVSRLLVLTFTNAAAAELKERLVNKLYDLKEEYLINGDIKNATRISKQITKVPMSDVSTIHAFCLNIIKNNFYNLGIDPNVTTLDATKATIMLNDIIAETIEQEYEFKKEEFIDELDILGSEESVLNTIYSLYMAYRNVIDGKAWLEKIKKSYAVACGTDLIDTEFGQVIFNNIKSKLQVLKIELEYVIDKLHGLEDFKTREDMLVVILKRINEAIELDTYNKLYNYLPTLLDMPRLPSTKVVDDELKEEVKAVKNKISEELKAIANIVYKDSEGIIEELNESLKYIDWYIDIIKVVDEKYTLAKKEKCVIDFSDYEHLALKVLEDENVVNKYKEKYEEIYIDEYQDTSNAQEAIIQKIAKEDNVIMVGDVKQSIYTFRNAKPELFSDKYEKLKEVQDAESETQAKIILAQNFRSRKEVLNSTNDIFSLLMSKDFGGARYEDKEALLYGEGFDESLDQSYKTEINIIEKDIEQGEEIDSEETEELLDIQIEANAAAKNINHMINSKFQVYDLKKKEYRACSYKDIVILLRTVENKAQMVSEVFASHGIPCFADSKTGFYKSEEIMLITAFLKVLNNPYDDISLVSVMYSIIGKFTLDELAIIRNNNTLKSILESLSVACEKLDDEQLINKIKAFLEFLEKYRNYLKTYKIYETLLKLYNETGIYEALMLESLGRIKCANLDNFVQIISEFEGSEQGASLYTLIKYLDVLKGKESAGDSPKLLGENEDVVRIMTMHKSKGLEFPIVILLGTAGQYNERDVKDKLQFDDELGIGIDVYNKQLGLTYPSVIKQAIKAKTKKTLRAEALRLLYVAMTRAKEKLIVYGTVPSLDKYTSKMMEIKNKKTSELIATTNNSHLKCILQAAMLKQENFNILLHNKNDFTTVNKADEEKLNRNEDRLAKFKKAVSKAKLKKDEKRVQQLREKMLVDRQFSLAEKKYTVTELKSSVSNISELKPDTLVDKITGTSYGTFIHSVVEHLNYNNITANSVLEVVEKIAVMLGVQEKINKKYVVRDIMNMYNIMKEYLLDAKSIKNELEFVIEDKLENIEGVAIDKPTLIQGVVDMYVVTHQDKHIIIDFKTDKVENSNELLDRYGLQLRIYKRAIELAYNIKVDNTFIYSFGLNKLIEVD